jgi:uncharacterized iron-regulated membrane protein
MASLRDACSTVHLWAGLSLGLVLIVLSLTGSILVFRAEIDAWLRPDLLRVEPSGPRVAPSDALRTAEAAFPDATPRLLQLPQSADAPYIVWLADNRHVFVDSYRGAVRGVRGVDEGWMNALLVLHTELFAGATGAWIVGLSGLLLVLLCGTGLVLWWPHVLFSKRAWRAALGIARRRLNYDLHRAGGFYTTIFLLVIALTGSGLVFYQGTGRFLNWATGSDAPLPPPTVEPAAGQRTSIDAALRVARRALPDARATFVYLPTAPGAPLTVRLRATGEWHPNGRSFVYLHPRSGRLLRADDARQSGLGARLLHALYPLHVGSPGGWPLQIAYVLLGLAPTVLSVTGTIIWYRRWRKKQRRLRAPRERAVRPVTADLPRPQSVSEARGRPSIESAHAPPETS